MKKKITIIGISVGIVILVTIIVAIIATYMYKKNTKVYKFYVEDFVEEIQRSTDHKNIGEVKDRKTAVEKAKQEMINIRPDLYEMIKRYTVLYDEEADVWLIVVDEEMSLYVYYLLVKSDGTVLASWYEK